MQVDYFQIPTVHLAGQGWGITTILMVQAMATTNQQNVVSMEPSEQSLEEGNTSKEKTTVDSEKTKVKVADPLAVSELVADLSIADPNPIAYIQYSDETQMPLIMRLIQKDLSEPYSIYTYRYFIHNWPNLCFLAMAGKDNCVGAIVCKLDLHKKVARRGYIAMLAVDSNYRKRSIGSTLVKKAIEAMVDDDADEVVLETEITNKPALKLYENLGFVRDKRLFRYYLNGVDASRLKLWLR